MSEAEIHDKPTEYYDCAKCCISYQIWPDNLKLGCPRCMMVDTVAGLRTINDYWLTLLFAHTDICPWSEGADGIRKKGGEYACTDFETKGYCKCSAFAENMSEEIENEEEEF